jgi:anti-sigma factor RsiW
MQAWQTDRDALRMAYAEVVREAVPPQLAATVWQGHGAAGAAAPGSLPLPAAGTTWPPTAGPAWARWPSWGLAASVSAIFLLGAGAGGLLTWQWQERQALAQGRSAAQSAALVNAPQAWLQRAAFAHSVYTIEPRHAVEVRAQEEHLARWLTRRIEAPVKLFDLRDMGFELVGGRLLPDGPGKGAQLMYQDGSGKRVTVYLRKPEPGSDTAFRYEQQGALGMFYWVEERTGFALVGELPKERLLAMAKSIYDQDARMPAPSLTPPASAASAGAASAPVGEAPAAASAPRN